MKSNKMCNMCQFYNPSVRGGGNDFCSILKIKFPNQPRLYLINPYQNANTCSNFTTRPQGDKSYVLRSN